MGLWGDGPTLWLSTLFQIWRLENVLQPGQPYGVHDRLYLPRVSCTVGNLDVHDVTVEASGRVVFAVTSFNCLATLSERSNFTPLWSPPFIGRLVKEDRCHRSGVAMDGGRVRYVTVVSRSDRVEGWRDDRRKGGCVLEVPSGRVVAAGLSMPHSPHVHCRRLWVLGSGTSHLGRAPAAPSTLRRILPGVGPMVGILSRRDVTAARREPGGRGARHPVPGRTCPDMAHRFPMPGRFKRFDGRPLCADETGHSPRPGTIVRSRPACYPGRPARRGAQPRRGVLHFRATGI
jgi:hypothetical protein